MSKKLSWCLLLALTITGIFTGCKPGHRTAHAQATDYFKTHWQDESQFIVETIAADVAEQVYYAKFHKVPEADSLYVTATEAANSAFATPTYDVEIDLDAKHAGLKNRLSVNGPIWSPEVYDGLTSQLAKAVGLKPGANEESKDTALLSKLTDGQATTIEKENERLSTALDGDFTNPTLHEQAALLLGAFTLREHSGNFFEIRSPLCRMTSHLAMARYLGGTDFSGINGRMAMVLLLTLINNQADAVVALKSIPTNNPALISWVRTLQAWNTGDYRPLDKIDGLSPIECLGWFQALNKSANSDIAWSRLSDTQKKIPDFVRIANENDPSVETGHELLDLALPLEFGELGAVYRLARDKPLKKENLVAELNPMPEHCFSNSQDGQTGLHIIGWGLWAGFFQRQLGHAIEQSFNMLQRKWGVPDEAHSFSTNMDQVFGGLRLYPFVRRFDAVTVDQYHQSVDEGFKVTVATPQLVPAECWNYLCYDLESGKSYKPNPNPHVNEWHKHNPPPGTVYDICPRLNHPSLTGRADTQSLLDQLHDRAPYDWTLMAYIFKHRYNRQPTYQQAEALFAEVLPYAYAAMTDVADSVKNQPEQYEVLVLRAAAINPSEYFTLGKYFAKLKQDDKAAGYFEKGTALDPDSVSASYHASWLIKYYLKHGRTEDACKEADFAGDVYSDVGLQAKAEFLEATSDYDGAYQWFAKNEERYDDSVPLIRFCERFKNKTGSSRFDNELRKRLGKIFPAGIENAALGDFRGAPQNGISIGGESDQTRAAGLKLGDIIVAINGVRIHNFLQYNYERDLTEGPLLDLIVWQGNSYHEIKASPPDHLFGVDFPDYPPKH
jgi:tetratricopeptide (TPR) repeat protein